MLKLGFEVAQSTVAKYMTGRRGPPSQGWRTFLQNQAPDIAAIDLFVAPTGGFGLLYGLVIIGLARRHLVRVNVTANPTADWILIGSIRCECLDHVVVMGEAHLRRALNAYADHYNQARTHRSLRKDCPIHLLVQETSTITSSPILGGLITSMRGRNFRYTQA